MAAGDERDHLDRTLRTLEQCALYRRTIRTTCPVCGHVVNYDAVALWWIFQRRHWEDRLPEAMRRFYCATCCKAHGRVVRPRYAITRDEPDAAQPPYPDKQAWSRLVARYRS